jgi:hypothetical protein
VLDMGLDCAAWEGRVISVASPPLASLLLPQPIMKY